MTAEIGHTVTAEIGHTVTAEIGHTGEIDGEEIDHMEGDTITGTKTLYFFWLAEIKVIFNIKQAGAELCQAQTQLS